MMTGYNGKTKTEAKTKQELIKAMKFLKELMFNTALELEKILSEVEAL